MSDLRDRLRRAADGDLPDRGERFAVRWADEGREESFSRWLGMICRERGVSPVEAIYRAVREAAERL